MRRIFTRFLQGRQPDLIHFHCMQGLTASLPIAAAELGVPDVVTVHDGWWISRKQFLIDELGRVEVYSDSDQLNVESYGPLGAKRAHVLRAALDGAERVISVSEPFASIYRKAGFSNVLTIENGLASLKKSNRSPSPDGKVRVGYFGGMQAHKGYPLVRAAFRSGRFQNLRLVVVDHSRGHGDSCEEIWGATPVQIVGRAPPDRVGELYEGLDVLLAPSIWPESYGLVTREALSFGLWVVASNRGAVGENVVEGENGFLVDVETTAGLVGALKTIDSDPGKFLEPTKSIAQIRLSAEQADRLIELYSELTTAPPRMIDRIESN
jgi:glycosyltransferase involved in cell wall biosynthesis